MAQDSLGSIRTVLSFGLQKFLVKKYEKEIENSQSTLEKSFCNGLFQGLDGLIVLFSVAAGIYFGVYSQKQSAELLSKSSNPSVFCDI